MEQEKLIALCKEKELTIGSAESLTAGLFASTLASVPGASAVLKGGFITYFTEMKEKMLDISPILIEKYGVISKQCARAMALNAKRLMDFDYALSFTGNAGPSAMEGKKAGLVFCAIAGPDGDLYDFKLELFDLERNAVRERAVAEMIHELLQIIQKKS